MSARSSLAAGASTWASSAPDSRPPGPARTTPPAVASSPASDPSSTSSPTLDSSTPALRELICSLAAFLASPLASPEGDSPRPTNAGSGPISSAAFAYFDPESCSWRTCQGSLIEDSETSSPDWPQRAIWDKSFAYELPTSERPTDASDSSSLLPTPSALESTPTEEFVEETREAGISPDERLYLPGRKWHAQRTLSRIVPALLPTPSASDSTGAEKETREARQESGRTGGPSLRDLPHLLPTPMANDENPGAGGELRAAIQHGPERSKLLPTPQASDGDGGRIGKDPETLATGKRPSGSKASVPLATALHGESSSQPSSSGSDSSVDERPGQLMIGDA